MAHSLRATSSPTSLAIRRLGLGFCLVLLGTLGSLPAWAQLTGAKTVGGVGKDYTTLAAAITALNASGVGAGGVTFNITAGYSETFGSTSAGYINMTALASGVRSAATRPVVFQKLSGAASTFTAANGVGATDAVIRLTGADYVTIDGLTLQGSAGASANHRTEMGISLLQNSATDGCQNNTIRNCSITLNKANSNFTDGIDIWQVNTATSAAGANSGNGCTSNTIQNVHTAFFLLGDGTGGFPDLNNEIGQTGLGNTVTNAGDNGAQTSVGVDADGQSGLKIVGNSFTSAATGNTGSAFNCINLRALNSGTAEITGNTISLTYNGTTSTAYGIRNQAPLTTLSLNGNTVSANYSGASSGVLFGITNEGAVGTLNIGATTGNTIQNMNLAGSGALYGIAVGQLSAGSPTTALNIQNNVVQNTTRTGSGQFFGILYNGTGNPTTSISSNQVINNTLTTTGNAFGILVNTSSVLTALTINNNLIKNLSKGTGAVLIGIRDWNGASSGSSTVSNNRVWSLSATGATQVTGLDLQDGASVTNRPVMTVQNNSVKVLSSGSGITSGINFDYGASGSVVSADSIITLSSAATVIGIQGGGSFTGGTLTVGQNTIGNLSGSGTTTQLVGIQTGGATTSTVTVSRNKVYSLTHSGATTGVGVLGISVVGSGAANVVNNLVGAFSATAANSADAIRGIDIATGTTINVFYNTVYLNAPTSSGTNLGTSGIYATTVPTTIDLRNNLVINTSVQKGSGRTTAFRRNATGLTNLATATTNNLWYAGTPGTNNLIFFDGTNTDQTLANYKTRVTPLDAAAKTENVAFASTTGSSTSFLHLDPAVLTVAESGGVAITSPSAITDDYDATGVRTGYPLGSQANGGGTAPDIGADEGDYSGYNVGVTALVAPSATQPPCYGTAETVTVRVRNYAGAPITFSAAVPLILTGSVSGAIAQTLTMTNITAGTIAAGGTADFSFSSTVNMSTVGTYTFSLAADVTNTAAGLTTDIKASDNTLSPSATRTVGAKPTATLTNNGPICEGTAATVSIALTGTGPWTFTYTDGTTPVTVTGTSTNPYTFGTGPLSAGATYSLTALSDANGCAATSLPAGTTVTVQPLPTFGTAKTDVTCNGANDGTITVTAAGGAGSYQFSKDNGSNWVSGASPYVFSSLAPAAYQIRVRNATGLSCVATATSSVTISQPTAISATTTPTPTTCPGGNDGQLAVSATGGTGTLEYSINSTTVYQPSNVFTGLSAVNYTIRVRDANGCVFTLPGQNPGTPAAFSVSPVATASTVCVGGTTTVTVTASGGTGTLEYSINNGTSYQPGNVFTGVTSGTKLVRVRDANSCVSSAASVIISTTTTTTWTGAIDSDWYNAGNWSHCVPSSTIDAVIPSGTPTINSGTAAVRDLDVHGTAVLAVTGTGNLDVYGAFTTATSTSFQPSVGTTHFRGSGAQTIPAATYVNLTVSGATAKVLTGNVSVASSLNLSAGMLRLANFDLLLSNSSSSITGAGASHFVVTDGAGQLGFAQVGSGGAGTVTFPIGSTTASSDYTPARLTNSGSQDTYYALVTDDIPQNPMAPQPGGPHVVKKTWDISEAVAGGSNVTLTLGWNTANEGASLVRALVAVSHFVSGVWDHPFVGWAPAVPGTFGSTWQIGRSGLTSFSPFAVQDANLPLPVELTRFAAEAQGTDALLTWETASERNAKGFEVQVSTEQSRGASSWRTLGFVASETPQSSTARQYHFLDTEKGKAGLRYYRLQQVDLDGRVSYSSTRTVVFGPLSQPALAAWPNPFAQTLTVELAAVAAGEAGLRLVDALGRVVWQRTVAVVVGSQQLSLPLSESLPTGTYLLEVRISGQILRQQLLKQ